MWDAYLSQINFVGNYYCYRYKSTYIKKTLNLLLEEFTSMKILLIILNSYKLY